MRPPDEIIGDKYLRRWYLFPGRQKDGSKPDSNKVRAYLHNFIGSDDDRAVHDHPGWSLSILLRGSLVELMPYESDEMADALPGTEVLRGRRIAWLWPVFRKATHTHRILLVSDSAWTIFIMGPKRREWGFWFWLREGGYIWKHWTRVTTADGKSIRGCE
jgi:hypothetical protein